jgi:hypothetical protein
MQLRQYKLLLSVDITTRGSGDFVNKDIPLNVSDVIKVPVQVAGTQEILELSETREKEG